MRDDIRVDSQVPLDPALEQIAHLLPPPMVRAAVRIPRQLWRDFREVAMLHHRNASEEARVVLQEYVRRYRSDLDTHRRRVARGEEEVDYSRARP